MHIINNLVQKGVQPIRDIWCQDFFDVLGFSYVFWSFLRLSFRDNVREEKHAAEQTDSAPWKSLDWVHLEMRSSSRKYQLTINWREWVTTRRKLYLKTLISSAWITFDALAIDDHFPFLAMLSVNWPNKTTKKHFFDT